MDINYELYKVFYYVAKTLSFSEAAQELFISQSAVSQSIKVLEKRLNQVLFVRSTKKVSLTKEGELLFKHIEPAINLICRGENQLLEKFKGAESQLRIGASDTICRYFLVPYLNQFHQKYPEVHIKVTNGTSLQCVDLLENNDVDLIVVNTPNSKLTNLMNVKSVLDFKDVFVAKEGEFDFGEEAITLEDLQKYPILMLDKHSTTSEFLHKIFLQNSLELVPEIELSSNDLLIDLAKIGLGIAFVPDFCVNEHTDLVKIHTTEEMPTRTLVVAYNDKYPLSEACTYFTEILGQ